MFLFRWWVGSLVSLKLRLVLIVHFLGSRFPFSIVSVVMFLLLLEKPCVGRSSRALIKMPSLRALYILPLCACVGGGSKWLKVQLSCSSYAYQWACRGMCSWLGELSRPGNTECVGRGAVEILEDAYRICIRVVPIPLQLVHTIVSHCCSTPVFKAS